MTRKMAYVVAVDSLHPIKGADAIEMARIGGWCVVTKKGEFKPGERAAYFEIDAFLPEGHPGWQFLVDKSARHFEGRRGHLLRTVKLRGQVSQGLLISLPALGLAEAEVAVGDDLGERLGVLKYERPTPEETSAVVLGGPFPERVARTDQQRIQNLAEELAAWQQAGDAWEVTEKLEGASCTFAWLDGELHVCSRNLDLLDMPGSILWKLARALDIEARLARHAGARNLALQGELIGLGVQGNLYGRPQHEFHLFDVYDADTASYLPPAQRRAFAELLGLTHVPVLDAARVLDAGATMTALLEAADGASVLLGTQLREGLVFKRDDGGASFKVVSNRYLLKQKD